MFLARSATCVPMAVPMARMMPSARTTATITDRMRPSQIPRKIQGSYGNDPRHDRRQERYAGHARGRDLRGRWLGALEREADVRHFAEPFGRREGKLPAAAPRRVSHRTGPPWLNSGSHLE